MQGVAEGAGVKYEDILTLNVRTEIAFGNESQSQGGKVGFSDGCTALSWNGMREDHGLLGQNWDWYLQFVCLSLATLLTASHLSCRSLISFK